MREVVRALPAVALAATKPATDAEVMEAVAPLFVLYPQPERTDGEWRAWWGFYFDALSDLSAASIRAACAAWAKTAAQFMPRPGELREFAQRTPTAEAELHMRLTRIAGKNADPLALAERREPTPQEREAVRRMAGEVAAALTKAKPAKEPPPPTHGKADEGGLTPQMRALMARRSEGANARD